MIPVVVIIIFFVYLITNQMFYLNKTFEGYTANSEKSKISDINTKTDNNTDLLNRLTDIIERSTDDLKYLSDDPSGSVKHTHDTLKTCLGNCNSVVIPKISKKKS